MCASAALAIMGVGLGASTAQAAGTFECTATALRIGSNETSVANPGGSPCANDIEGPINLFVPLGGLGSVHAIGLVAATQANNPTSPGVGHGGNAQAGAAGVTVRLLGQTIQVGVIRTLLFGTCPTGDQGPGTPPPHLRSAEQSDIVGVSINGRRLVNTGQPVTLPLGVVTVYLNREIRTSNSLTRRALEIQSPLLPAGGIVVGESRLSYTGNPCTA